MSSTRFAVSHSALRTLARIVAVAAILSGAPAWAFPDKPITLVVPYPPGGATDTVGRIVAKGISQRLGQPVIVDNRAGAGTVIGATAVAQAQPDGYTLLISSNTTFTVNPALKPKLGYDPIKSFESIGTLGSSPLVLLANPALAANDVKSLVALARSQPGRLSYGSFGNGTTSHFAGEMFKVMAGVEILHVPYKGSAPAMTDLMGGQVQLTFDTNVAALPQVQAGKVKAIAVTSKQRSPTLPNVPTIAEAGYPDYEMVPWITIVLPRGAAAPVKAALSKAFADTIADAAIRADLQKAGVDVLWQSSSDYEPRVNRELPLLKSYVQKANITVE